MIDENNPAGRLHHLLQRAQKSAENQKVRSVWSKIFGCEETEDAVLIARILATYELSQEVQELISLNPSLNKELYLSSFENVRKAILPLNLDQSWAQQRKFLSGEVLTRLQFCSEALSGYYTEESIDSEELTEIREYVPTIPRY